MYKCLSGLCFGCLFLLDSKTSFSRTKPIQFTFSTIDSISFDNVLTNKTPESPLTVKN